MSENDCNESRARMFLTLPEGDGVAYGYCRSCSSLRTDENIERLISLLRRLSFLECVSETEDRIRQRKFIRYCKQGAKYGKPVRVGERGELAQGVAIGE